MTQPWNPVGGFKTLMAQLTKGLIFDMYAHTPISDINVVGIEICLILDTGLYAKEYKIWYDKPPALKIFLAFKTYWENQVHIKNSQ